MNIVILGLTIFVILARISIDAIDGFHIGAPRFTRRWTHMCIAISFVKNKLDIVVNGENMDRGNNRKCMR